jgi:hypothetical protein
MFVKVFVYAQKRVANILMEENTAQSVSVSLRQNAYVVFVVVPICGEKRDDYSITRVRGMA